MKTSFMANRLSGAVIPLQVLAGVALALLPGSCSQNYTPPAVVPRLVAASSAPVEVLDRGYLVYQAKCGKCHPFENPARYPADALALKIMPEMARKAKLDVGDARAVLAYVLAAREQMPGGGP